MTWAISHYLTLSTHENGVEYRFQNFYINETVPWVNGDHTFLPFGFSGVMIDREGGNVTSSLTFPNNELSRSWGREAIENFWIARVRVVNVDPDDPTAVTGGKDDPRVLLRYVGQVAAATWDETQFIIELTSVLDAVGETSLTVV